MPPRHFWWLMETLEANTKRKGLDADTRAMLKRALEDAQKGNS